MVFSNCYSFNQPEEEIVANAQDLENLFRAKIAAMPMPEREVDLKVKDISVAKCSRETLGLQDYLSSYFSPSPGVKVRSRRCTQRTNVGLIEGKGSKKTRKVTGRGRKKMSSETSQQRNGSAIGNAAFVGLQVQAGRKRPEDDDVNEGADDGDHIEPKQDGSEFSASSLGKLDHFELSPSMVTTTAKNWKDIKPAKGSQQSSAKFKRRIEHTSRTFPDWGGGAKVKHGRLTDVSLPGMRVCALLATNKADVSLVKKHEEDFGEQVPDDEERDLKTTVEEQNMTLGCEEASLSGAAKVQRWLEDCDVKNS